MAATTTATRPAASGGRSRAPRGRGALRPAPVAGPADPSSTGAPLPPSAAALLARSDAELLAAQLAGVPRDQLLHAHLSALRAGAALLQVTGRPGRPSARRDVWSLVAAAAPELEPWTAFFAAGAALRAALETGRVDEVDGARAEATLAAAEDFQDAVRSILEPVAERGPVRGLRVS